MTSPQTKQLLDLLDGFEMTKSQHDWLEQRFSNMTEKEKLLFRGGMGLERPQGVSHVMLIAPADLNSISSPRSSYPSGREPATMSRIS